MSNDEIGKEMESRLTFPWLAQKAGSNIFYIPVPLKIAEFRDFYRGKFVSLVMCMLFLVTHFSFKLFYYRIKSEMWELNEVLVHVWIKQHVW